MAKRKRPATSMGKLAKDKEFWRIFAIVAGALILVWVWCKLRF